MPDLSQTDPGLSRGGGILGIGMGDIARANEGMQASALSESERMQYNQMVEAKNKLGISKLSSMAGSVAGTAIGGPVGGAIGGMAAGMISSGVF